MPLFVLPPSPDYNQSTNVVYRGWVYLMYQGGLMSLDLITHTLRRHKAAVWNESHSV